MEKMVEIRWHGRGGQGAKTAALVFGEALLSTGQYIQAFPEYGPERMGAPVLAFNRISEKPITAHCGITEPHFVVVLDDTLLDTIDVTDGVDEKGVVLVNSSKPKAEIQEKLKNKKCALRVVNANRIAKECFGKEIPNMPMMGALVKVVDFLDIEKVILVTEEKLKIKFSHKPELIEGNLKAIRMAHKETE